MARFLPVGKDAQGAARFLLAALPALGALLTALAITGDLVGRMARNHPWATFAAFGCAALAVFLGAIAAFALREGSGLERRVLYTGLVILGAGLVSTVYAGVRTWGDRPQPSITVTPTGSVPDLSVHVVEDLPDGGQHRVVTMSRDAIEVLSLLVSSLSHLIIG